RRTYHFGCPALRLPRHAGRPPWHRGLTAFGEKGPQTTQRGGKKEDRFTQSRRDAEKGRRGVRRSLSCPAFSPRLCGSACRSIVFLCAFVVCFFALPNTVRDDPRRAGDDVNPSTQIVAAPQVPPAPLAAPARLPRQIAYIIGNEGCERFSF